MVVAIWERVERRQCGPQWVMVVWYEGLVDSDVGIGPEVLPLLLPSKRPGSPAVPLIIGECYNQWEAWFQESERVVVGC